MNAPPTLADSLAKTPATSPPVASGVVLTTGTPFGGWGPLAAALLGAAPAGADLRADALAAWCDMALGDAEARAASGAVNWLGGGATAALPAWPDAGALWGGVDARLVWAVGAVDCAWPAARWIILVEPPAAALAARLATDGAVAVDALLQSWCAGCEALLCLLRDAPQRCIAIDVDEARQQPAAAVRRIGERLELTFGVPVAPAAPATDPLALAVAEGLIAADHRARTLHAELVAACPVLDGTMAPISPNDAVLRRWRALTDGAACAATTLREVAELRRTLDQCVAQAGQMQEELEYLHAELREAKRVQPTRAAGAASSGDGLSIGRIELGAVRDTPPHRELSLRVEDICVGPGCAQAMDLRLVEHHGLPGLVIFGDAGRSVLTGWSESGQEDGRGFLLLVPEDPNTHTGMARLGATDWRLLVALVARLRADLAAASDLDARLFWVLAAGRLQQQLAELPPQLRTDTLTASPQAEAAGGGVELVAGGWLFGDRIVHGLRVHLVDGPRIALAGADPRGVPPLPSWPLHADGRPFDAWELPLGASPLAASGRTRWDGVTAADRDFVVALLDALPVIAGRPEIAGVLASAGLSAPAGGLPALADEARASLPRHGLRRRFAAALRHLHGR